MRSNTARSLLLFAVVFLLGGWILPHLRVSWSGPPATAAPAETVDVSHISPEEIYARAAATAAPAVVNIDTEKNVRVRSFFFDDDFFGPRYRRVAGTGSGVLINSEGDIITNDHVVAGADSIVVTLHDGRKFTGRVIGSDHPTDVALVKISGSNLPAARLGTSKGLIPGQLAVAIGNPLGLRFTVTHGIVSALGRPIKIGDRVYENLIQTDCAINPGNSGGALADREGRVIGINTLVAESANGVGFAIPIDTAQRIAAQLKKYGKVKRPWTGLYCEPITPGIQAYLGLDSREGAFVAGIVQGSPADQAGIRGGDILLELNGRKVRDDDDVRHITEKLRIGDRAKVRIRRGGEYGVGEMVIAESP